MAVDGNWNISIETPIGTRQATLNIAADGSSLTGTQAADGNSTAITDGTGRRQQGFMEGRDCESDANDARILGHRGRR